MTKKTRDSNVPLRKTNSVNDPRVNIVSHVENLYMGQLIVFIILVALLIWVGHLTVSIDGHEHICSCW